MRAVVIDQFGGPETLHVVDIPIQDPAPGQVRIRVAAAAVNPVDLGVRAGKIIAHEQARFPMVLGWDVAGHVNAVGEGVTHVRAGDKVIALSPQGITQIGTYAEYIVLPAKYVAIVPDGVELTTAASLPLAGLTALQALEKLSLVPGEMLLINGPLGAVGNFAVQLAARQHIIVLGAVHEKDAELARSLGVHIALDRQKDLAEQVHQVIPAGVDAALDLVGGAAIQGTLTAVRDGGRYATVIPDAALRSGGRAGTASPEWKIPSGPFVPQRSITASSILVRSDVTQLASLVNLLAAGQLITRVTDVFPLERASEAHQLLAAGGLHGKIVLVP
ncbi:NADPH:quinone reductase [Reticulibacter mediterranei]|uniref:NADPH:quinone reductase n=1 Tax=Reticulibacter mediterranei TaxID=2778369 RepID=A0A8J3IC52_9CHLR|nr:NADP-dependent oxidoreductase [Reticulibacter mediterranei]GHO92699.1 NADPH:quinone reductase [Reticulibacter mediterranei]